MNTLKPSIMETYEQNQKARYMEFLNDIGSDIRFEMDTWICDKRIRSFAEERTLVTLYFSSIPTLYRTVVKFFAIIRILNGKGVRNIKGNVLSLAPFLNFLHDGMDLSQVNLVTAMQYKAFLDNSDYKASTRFSLWSAVSIFIKTMDGWDGKYLKNPFAENPYESHHRLDYKYIPEEIADQLDTVFMREDIDLTIKCIYWILRLIPSRIGEVRGMRIDCLKPFSRHYCLFIPTWKQNGGNKEPILRVIHIEDKGISAHLLSLIREQQELARSLQILMPNDKKDALFTYRGKIFRENGSVDMTKSCHTASWGFVNNSFKRICRQYHICDENSQIYSLSSHQFRHNGITDRLESGFTLAQIADMTGHHGDAMLFASYAHLDLKPKTLVRKQQYVLNEQTSNENSYVLFGGRILGMEEQLEKRLLKNIRAHRVRGGICSDITGCKSDMWDCLDCKHFIPDKAQLPYFREQVLAWEYKAEKFKDYLVIQANAFKNAALFAKIVKKIVYDGGELDE
jgi:integrase